MTVATPGSSLGRHVFGVTALAFGLITLAWHEYNGWHLLGYIAYAAAAAEIFGGAAIQFRRAAKTGAAVLSAAYLVFALACVPGIVVKPQIYNSWGNFFEQFSLVTGAAIVYARLSSAWSQETLHRIGRILMGICAASFTLEQAVYLHPTASLVPKWVPPSQMFWAIATTVLFALAAVALLTNRMALLAARLLTMMLVMFGLLVWVPLVLSAPRSPANWSENAETFAIAGAAWILADLLSDYRLNVAPLTKGASDEDYRMRLPPQLATSLLDGKHHGRNRGTVVAACFGRGRAVLSAACGARANRNGVDGELSVVCGAGRAPRARRVDWRCREDSCERLAAAEA